MQNYLLSTLIFLPLLACIVILFLPSLQKQVFKWITLFVCFAQMLLSLVLYFTFDTSLKNQVYYAESSFQFVEKVEWIRLELGSFGILSIDYFVGIDGLSLAMVLLTGVVMLVGAIASFSIDKKEKGYFALYLLLNSTLIGCFVALDFFLFYLFFEFMLLPMYFLIGIWGGIRREYAAIKFFIYTLIGSILILIVMIALYLSVIDPLKTFHYAKIDVKTTFSKQQKTQEAQSLLASQKIETEKLVHTFNILYMSDKQNYIPSRGLDPNRSNKIQGFEARWLAFLALLIGFAIKLPVVPLHTWLPDAHVEAPTPVSVVLAGVLLKIGAYGILRLGIGIFPDVVTHYTWWIGAFGVLSILYGAMNALAMSDLKKMIAYSSVSHMGFVMLGIASLTSEGINGAIFQMFSHGILSAMLFLIAGVLYDRTHNREITGYRGLIQPMPQYAAWVLIGFFASLGLPGFSAFIGELFTIAGSFTSEYIPIWMGILGAFGIVLSAAYFLWTYQRMFFGNFWVKDADFDVTKLTDLTFREKTMLIFLAFLTILIGIFPQLVFKMFTSTVQIYLRIFESM